MLGIRWNCFGAVVASPYLTFSQKTLLRGPTGDTGSGPVRHRPLQLAGPAGRGGCGAEPAITTTRTLQYELHGTHQTPAWPSQSQETPGLPCDPPVRHARLMNESNGPSATPQRDVRAVSGVLRELEGREVSLALADGSRLDCVMLISAGRGRTPTVWLFANGIDVFLPRLSIIAAWEAPPASAARPAA